MVCHHYCNEPLRCPTCARRFWAWAQQHSHGRRASYIVCRPDGTRTRHVLPGFYGSAALFIGIDRRVIDR